MNKLLKIKSKEWKKYEVRKRKQDHSAPVVLTREQREHWRWRYVESKSEVVAT